MLARAISTAARSSTSAVRVAAPSSSAAPSRSFGIFTPPTQMEYVPLDQPLFSTHNEVGKFATALPTSPAQITKLPNGLRVASRDNGSPISAVGVFVDSGSRYEPPHLQGISHFLEQLTFKSTKPRQEFRVVRDIAYIGAHAHATTSRDHSLVAAEVLREKVPEVMELLGESINEHAFRQWEIDELSEKFHKRLSSQGNRIELDDAIHAAAFHRNTLGLPVLPSVQSLPNFTPEVLAEWQRTFFAPERMVLSGIGIDHDQLVSLGKITFKDTPASDPPVEKVAAQYTGGEVRSNQPGGQDGSTHIAIGFKSPSWFEPEVYSACVLQILLGGGGAFSSGGPGKGMHSRLYRQVLNQYAFAENCTAFSMTYSDGGVFGLYGAVLDPSWAQQMTLVLCDQIKACSELPTQEELDRAKNTLKGSLFMTLESRTLQLEDLGRQVGTQGKFEPTKDIEAKIDAVTREDIAAFGKSLVQGAPSIVAIGDLAGVPEYRDIAAYLAK